MIRGFYSATGGLRALQRTMETITENLANLQTPGYKQIRDGIALFDRLLVAELAGLEGGAWLGPLDLPPGAVPGLIDLSPGPLDATGRDLDLALEGPGFFAVQTAEGVRYTRDGTFTRDADGRLVTPSGAWVLGEAGPLFVPAGTVQIDRTGAITVDGQPVGRLRLVEFAPEVKLRRLGQNQYLPDGGEPLPAVATGVHQGYLERANVDLAAMLTAALTVQRAYEANQRLIQIQDQLLGRAISEIARPSG